ncbi:hypothetical protein OOZ15_12965 [Galbibacter sp. EGI 63066]|uniref:type II toxin-antitoxin system RelE/ParE family toxin n=1 Tax=Galbibacter sp. EGI 63066 TaxID=2993559 RepID=UPI002248F9A7|nr:hypothetical protein [Galbibacter sp. EGI 63066]MCX2680858.1 hypothetical protein [Galbibacter sp. EGI 63066]
MEVVWSEESLRNYYRTIDYLILEWDVSIAIQFDKNLIDLVERVRTFEEICPKSKLLQYHKCPIDKNNSLIYKIINNTLFIVTIIDNRSNHSY